jgi:uncharacterized protein
MAALHARAAGSIHRLHVLHAERLHCAHGCKSCCVDDLTVFETEANLIREAHAQLLAESTPHARGGCAFLSVDGGCRIYAERPYVCRTQGLPLRWVLESGDAEQRDICPLNEVAAPGQAIELLAAEDCWTLGPFEEQIAELEIAQRPAAQPRVALRSMFAARNSSDPPR